MVGMEMGGGNIRDEEYVQLLEGQWRTSPIATRCTEDILCLYTIPSLYLGAVGTVSGHKSW